MIDIYRLLDAAVAAFAKRTSLSCPQGCGHCCLSEKVEATILECIPLAFHLFRTSQADDVLQRLAENRDNNRCILYRPECTQAGNGGCSGYGLRVVVCRLFGFAGNLDPDGLARLALCQVMKAMVGSEQVAIIAENRLPAMPLFAEAGLRITALHPGLGTTRMPINAALWQALMKVGMFLDLQAVMIPR